MRAILVVIAVGFTHLACSESEPRKRPEAAAWMGRLIKPARPCIERFRGRIQDPYLAQVNLTPTAGFIVVSFESGNQAEFNACVVEAVAAAHVPAQDLGKAIVVPFAFSFAEPIAN